MPTLTDRLDAGTQLPVAWFGVQLNSLLEVRSDGSGEVQAWLRRGEIAAPQRVVETATPVVTLHGNDHFLRAFWGIDRLMFYELLKNLGVSVVTGPTFSVYDDAPNWPASQSVMMLLHHNRVLDELYRAGFVAAPNLFWRRVQDQQNWIDWLKEHSGIGLVSRDFSCTRVPQAHAAELKILAGMIDKVGRPMHVVLLGVGVQNAWNTIKTLDSVGATCSIISGNPMMIGRHGKSLIRKANGKLECVNRPERSLGQLALENVIVFEAWVRERAMQLPAYQARKWANFPGTAIKPCSSRI